MKQLRNRIDECARVEIELKKSQIDLRHLSAELLNAHEKERKMVARKSMTALDHPWLPSNSRWKLHSQNFLIGVPKQRLP